MFLCRHYQENKQRRDIMETDLRIGISDMTEMSEIDERGINENLHVRYCSDVIYTYTGSILIAVNPYKCINIFNKEYVKKYHGSNFGVLKPHVFALAEEAYKSIVDDHINQIVILRCLKDHLQILLRLNRESFVTVAQLQHQFRQNTRVGLRTARSSF
ncbi:uncharacterized protein Myo81F isoform X5 [Drosophila bipectinata]|uniref:uncharacterized protein Myo81F isoform X5 n=1 Tax=Drosophila bipectinata TaxID=42026 RepID=UPI0038B392A3